MSMLAEPRRKQRVFNLRAKNSAWSNDGDKFGQKMLEKMGWSAGKGLGAREDGVVEHVLARYKNDSAGLGFEDRNDQWTKNEQDFEGLLRSLSGETGDSNTVHKPTSLEEKSKKSSSRVHYHKFTRGKDLTKYSEKDLANIFGKKCLKEKPKPAEIESVEVKEEKNGTGQLFTTKGTMADYFKGLKRIGTNKEFDDVTFAEPPKKTKKKNRSKDDDDDDENYFAFNDFSQIESVDEKIERSELSEPVGKSSKKKKKTSKDDDDENDFAFSGFSQAESVDEKIKRSEFSEPVSKSLKKKKKSSKNYDDDENDFAFNGFLQVESVDEKIEKSESSEPVSKSSKKKKKSRCKDDAVNEIYNGFSQLNSVEDKIGSNAENDFAFNGFSHVESVDEKIERSDLSEPVSKSSKKNKKKNRRKDDAVNEEDVGFSLVDSVEDKIGSDTGCQLSKKSKKITPVDVIKDVHSKVDAVSKPKKKSKKDKIICEQAVDEHDANIDKNISKKSKKRKQSKLESEDMEPEDSGENARDKSKKKKKRKSVIF